MKEVINLDDILKTFDLGKTVQGKVRKSQRKEILFIERSVT